MWAVAGALLALAPVASAASYDLVINGARTYATESITSEDVAIDYRGDAPQAVFSILIDSTEVPLIDRNDTIDVTFTLRNAKLARNISASALTPTQNDQIVDCGVRVRSAEGDRGSVSAMFSVEADTNDCSSAGGGGRIDLTFTLPSLMGLDPTKPVSVRVTTDTPGGSGWPRLMGNAGVDTAAACADTGMDDNNYCADVTNGVLSAQLEAGGEIGIIRYASGLTFRGVSSGGAGSPFPACCGNPRIDLAGGRTAFSWPGQSYLGNVTVGITSAAACTLREAPYGATTSACTLQANGMPFSLGRGGHGRGDLNVTVTGDFRSGDTVFLDLDGNHAASASERLSLQNDGSMQGSFGLDRVAGNAGAAEGDAGEMNREEGLATKNLIYRPNGTHPLRPGEYRSRFSVTTSSTAVADKDTIPAEGSHETRYTLVEGTAKDAYAIPPMRAGDSGMVRVKCEVATQCMVYLECDDQDGMSYFAEVETPVPGRSTLELTAEDLSSELGLMEGDWESGRMSCSIYSTREISVQQLTRSSTGVLVNNTYVADD